MSALRSSVASLVLLAWSTTAVHAQPQSTSGVDGDTTGVVSTSIPVTIGNTEVMGAEGTGVSAPPAAISLEQPIDAKTYICGPGDVFELNFWGKQNFRLRIAADLEGRTFISKVGYVTVEGHTLSSVRDEIRKKVRANYPGLMFDLTLINPRSFLVHVVENVKLPGSYKATAVERVSTIVARAGIAGSRRRIAIKHRNGKEDTADLLKYELTGDTKYNPYVLDGDVIRVPFAEVTASIAGAVRRPGMYELVDTKDLNELIVLAGGFSTGVAKTLPIRLIRRNGLQHAKYEELPFTSGTPKNAPLLDDDQIVVRGVDEYQRTVTLLGAVAGADPLDSASTVRRLPYIEGDTVRTLIDRAGGIRAPGDLRRSYISRPRKDADPELIPVDLEALLMRRDFSADRPVQLDDTIVVPPMQYSVLIEGAVARAGLYPYNPKFGVTQYIAQAGGRTRTARDLDDVQRIDSEGHTHDFSGGMKILPGDAILVPERNFTRGEIAQLAIAGAGLLLSGLAITIAATR